MSVHDKLGIRMKKFYEEIPKTKLMRRTPVACRIDGKAFHTLTRGFNRPFDEILIKSMQDTMKYLCENVEGCVLGYQQSDEITLILIDYKKLNSDAFFDYEVQKMCSIIASMATMAFNKYFSKNVCKFVDETYKNKTHDKERIYCGTILKAMENGAMFDTRVFNIPKEEVTNLIYWRQLDATRNSIQMVGQANFSHNELHGKSCNMIQDMLMLQKGINWNNLPAYQKRGSCCIKKKVFVPDERGSEYNIIQPDREEVKGFERNMWVVDKNIPVFTGESRDYIEKLIYVGE